MSNKKSALGSSSNITITVINQDGDKESCMINSKIQLGKLMRRYCDQKSVNADSVVFLFGDCFLQKMQIPVELRMQDGDTVYAFHAKSLTRNKRGGFSLGAKEGWPDQSQVEMEELADKDPGEKDIHDTALAFDELEKRNTSAYKQAKLFLKAAFEKSSRLTKNARKYVEEVQIKTNSLKEDHNTRIMIEKKLAEKELMIEKMQNELRKANAANANLSRERTLVAEELAKVKKELVKSKDERVNVLGKKVDQNKRGVASGRPHSECKKPRLGDPVSINKSVPKEEENPTDEQIVIKFYLDGESTLFRLWRSTMFGKLMKTYRDQDSLVLYQMRFIYNGSVIGKEQTPDELEMEDGEEVIVVLTTKPGKVIISRQDQVPADRNWFFRVLCDIC